MEQYIDKSKLLEELKRCEKICDNYIFSHKDTVSQGIANAKRAVCQHFIKFINTLEVKEVDLDKELDFVKDAYYYFTSDEKDSMMKVARHFFELGLKTKGE